MKVRKQFVLLITALVFMSMIMTIDRKYVSAEQYEEGNSCSMDRGLDVVLVMDNSGSMMSNDPTNIRIEAASNMVDELHAYDRISVVKFNEGAENLQPLTDNRFAIKQALNSLVPGGGTDISAGMGEALKEFDRNDGNNHKVMIILSDGYSINNTISMDHAQKAKDDNITIYTIGLGSKADIDELLLMDIASKTGGQYFQAVNATGLTATFVKIRQAIEDLREPKIYSNWTLTQDLHMPQDLVLHENMKMDLNGYNLKVDGTLVLLSCSELRATSGEIRAGKLEQMAGSTINLNNSQLDVVDFKQNGLLRVNGDYGGLAVPEVVVNSNYEQQARGYLDLQGYALKIGKDFLQEGRVHAGGGSIQVNNDVTQQGSFKLQKGELFVNGNLYIKGGLLNDEDFEQNKSLNVGGGLIQVGSAESMSLTRATGNIVQESGQLYLNHGAVRVYGDYTIKDGWLTMIKGSMDTTSASYDEGDGDYVHVYGDFSMESQRNHGERSYQHLGKPMNDQAHLTDGVLQVDGNFRQMGDKQFHPSYSDRSQSYSKNYSRFNFSAAGRHKVLLTGSGKIDVQGSGFHFNILELQGRLVDYERFGPVKWSQLIERDLSANANLERLTINDIPVRDFDPNVLNYYSHVIPSKGVEGSLLKLKVDARASDHRNAKVEVIGNSVGVDGTAKVQVLVTAHDGKTTKLYTVHVTVGGTSSEAVSSVEVDQTHYVMIKNGTNDFSPSKVTIGYRVLPTTADNQRVRWTSTDPTVATVNAQGIVTPLNVGKTTIVVETEEGGFTKSVNIEVKLPFDLLEGVKTLADFVEDTERYNQIMALYDPKKIGIVVPGRYIHSMTFTPSGNLVSGKITAHTDVKRVEVRVNNQQLSAQNIGTTEYLFSRAGLSNGDYLEVIAYNNAGDELERIATSYPVEFQPISAVPYGFYSIERLFSDPGMFSVILDYYSPEKLRFTTTN
jgi:uncharacterized protein YegL